MIIHREKYVYFLSIIIPLFILFLALFILSVMCTFYSYVELVIKKFTLIVLYSDTIIIMPLNRTL